MRRACKGLDISAMSHVLRVGLDLRLGRDGNDSDK